MTISRNLASSISTQMFDRALNRASKNDFAPLTRFMGQIGPLLVQAKKQNRCPIYYRQVETLLIATTIAAIVSWHRPSRKWSRRVASVLRLELPADLRRSLRNIELSCRDRCPVKKVILKAPPRWGARVWFLAPVSKTRDRWNHRKK